MRGWDGGARPSAEARAAEGLQDAVARTAHQNRASNLERGQTMSTTAYVFPDTNILLQSLHFSNIRWQDSPQLAAFEQIELLICHPIVMELDKHKYRPADRTGKRARKLYALLRPLIEQKALHYTIRETNPHITIRVITDLQPKDDFLEYSLADNRILGCVQQYIDTHGKSQIFFLTHDMGAVATAQQAAVPCVFAPGNWRMAPEVTDSQREIAKLTAEIARLRRSEPEFQIRILTEHQQELDEIEYECEVPAPLTDMQIESLLDELQRGILLGPGPRPRPRMAGTEHATKRSVTAALGDSAIGHGLLDAMAATISREPQAYAEWISKCEAVLRSLHYAMQAQNPEHIFDFGATNHGTRPASNALITITSLGPLRVSIPVEEDDEVDAIELQKGLSLPYPPQRGIGFPYTGSHLLTPSVSSLASQRANRDPDAFYYRTRNRILPTDSIALECRQWRHGSREELFTFALHVASAEPDVSGAVSCTIEAGNLSDVKRLTVPIRIEVKATSIADHATELVRRLIESEADSH